ncbi:MAG: amidohydrolase family protein [Phycisphaerae bacterium]|nr:amidohydrolase family protein [Phycisphaerae bacterium]
MKTVKLKGGFVVTGKNVERTDIILSEGRILLAGEEEHCDQVVDITGKYVVPGFVDIHFHGYNLFEFTSGLYDVKSETFDNSPAAYDQGFEMLSNTLLKFGVTGFYVGTWASPITNLRNCYAQLYRYLSNASNQPGARILGGLLEGSFLNPQMAGAQNPDYVLEFCADSFDRIEDKGTIKLANVAPDFCRQSYELTEYLAGKGIVVGAGHSNATCQQIMKATKAGLKYFIHLTNGPTGGSYKPFNGGGAIEAVLKSDELYAEQILDGYHVNPAYVRDILKRKGADRIIGITDCLFAAGSQVRQFTSGGIRGAVSEDGQYFQVVGKTNTLFSSNLTMNRGFSNLLNWLTIDMQGIWNRLHNALEFEQALVIVAKILSTNPCVLTGLDKKGYGSIKDGATADLCVLDITGSQGSYNVEVESTIVDGRIVYSAA